MSCLVRVLLAWAEGLQASEPAEGPEACYMFRGMAGYVLEQPSAIPRHRTVEQWAQLVVITSEIGQPEMGMSEPELPSSAGIRLRPVRLRPVGRVVSAGTPQLGQETSTARTLRPVQSGEAYRISSAPTCGLVTPELAQVLETVFDRFAHERGFTAKKPLEIALTRGFKADSQGHGEGRAADIVAVGGKSLLKWKQERDNAMAAAETLGDPQQRAAAIAGEQARNLGYGLYQALQAHGGWRVNPGGWRVYRGVMQLFGPWTATEGPWKVMHVDSPTPAQRQRLADQQWVFQAHEDHIHVAR